MPKTGQLKFYKISPEAQEIIRDGLDNGIPVGKLSKKILRETKETISPQAISNWKRIVKEANLKHIELLQSLERQLQKYAPEGVSPDDFSWLQGLLLEAVKNQAAQILTNGGMAPELVLEYVDKLEHRRLQQERLELDKLRAENDRIKHEADLRIATNRLKQTEMKIEEIRKKAGKNKDKKISSRELDEIVGRLYGK